MVFKKKPTAELQALIQKYVSVSGKLDTLNEKKSSLRDDILGEMRKLELDEFSHNGFKFKPLDSKKKVDVKIAIYHLLLDYDVEKDIAKRIATYLSKFITSISASKLASTLSWYDKAVKEYEVKPYLQVSRVKSKK